MNFKGQDWKCLRSIPGLEKYGNKDVKRTNVSILKKIAQNVAVGLEENE